MDDKDIKTSVREGYAKIATRECSCCAPVDLCCTRSSAAFDIGKEIGYSEEELKKIPDGANLGLGCGNPVALAGLKKGETVLDLGSGAGFDCFLAADRVGKEGRVIGVDMTPEMLERARKNASTGNFSQVEFRLGEIENIPAGDTTVDVVISNCVINLSPDKERVFREAFRVLKPGGRLIVSDIVLIKELPGEMRTSMDAYIGCIAGAIWKDEYIAAIENAGFHEVTIIGETPFAGDLMANDLAAMINESPNVPFEIMEQVSGSITSLKVNALKPD